jgi:hypothetical protein
VLASVTRQTTNVAQVANPSLGVSPGFVVVVEGQAAAVLQGQVHPALDHAVVEVVMYEIVKGGLVVEETLALVHLDVCHTRYRVSH